MKPKLPKGYRVTVKKVKASPFYYYYSFTIYKDFQFLMTDFMTGIHYETAEKCRAFGIKTAWDHFNSQA